MNSFTFNLKSTLLIKKTLFQSLCICQLLIISNLSLAEQQVDLLTIEPILVYEMAHERIIDTDSLKIEVYNDGHVIMHYPSYMKNSGTYTVQLSDKKLQKLIETLDTPNVKNFNNKALKLEKKEQDDINGVFSYVSDSSYSSFEISRRDQQSQNKIKQKIQYPHLQFDAKQYPKTGKLNKLAEVETILSSLINHKDLQELDNE